MANALITSGLISGAMGALGSIIRNVGASDEARRQSILLKNQLSSLNAYEADSLSRINSIFDAAKGSVKEAMLGQADLAVNEITTQFTKALDDQANQLSEYKGTLTDEQAKRRETYVKVLNNYRDSIHDQRQMITNSFAQARMGTSGAFLDAMGKSAKEQAKSEQSMNSDYLKTESEIFKQLANAEVQFARERSSMTDEQGRRIQNTRLDAGSKIAQAMAVYDLQKGQSEMALRDQMQGTRMAMEGKIGALDQQAARYGDPISALLNGTGDMLSGFMSGGGGDVAAGLMTGDPMGQRPVTPVPMSASAQSMAAPDASQPAMAGVPQSATAQALGPQPSGGAAPTNMLAPGNERMLSSFSGGGAKPGSKINFFQPQSDIEKTMRDSATLTDVNKQLNTPLPAKY